MSINRTGLKLNLELGNSDGTSVVYDTSTSGANATMVNSPTLVEGADGYVDLNGTSQYGTLTGTGIFNTANVGIVAKISPDFEADDSVAHFIMDGAGTDRYLIWKKAGGNQLQVFLGNTLVSSIETGVYQQYWKVGEENIIIVSSTTGNNNLWLNGVQLQTGGAMAWTPKDPATIWIGASNANTLHWDGKIYSVEVFDRLLTEDEVARYSADRQTKITTHSNDGCILDLQMGNNNGTSIVYDSCSGFDFTETGTVTFVEGSDGYIETNNIANNYIGNTTGGIYGSSELSFAIGFTPDFAPTTNDTYVFTNSSGSRYFIAKLPNGNANVIRLQFADAVGNDVVLSGYEDYWKVGEENVLVITTDSAGGAGATKAYLNNMLVSSSSAAWTPAAESEMTISGQVNQGFGGKTHFFSVWGRIITEAEIANISAYRKTAIVSAPNTGLSAYWNMDNNDISGTTLYDKSGSVNGTLTNSPTTGVAGVKNQAINFARANLEYVSLGNNQVVDANAFTISLWVKTSQDSILGTVFDCQTNQGAGHGVYIRKDTSNYWNMVVNSAIGTAKANTVVSGEWEHIVGTYDGTTVLLYIDSVLQTDTGSHAAPATFDGSRDSSLGRLINTSYMDGDLDEVRVYNRALSQLEVTNLYNATSTINLR